jgi:hypothetical protein
MPIRGLFSRGDRALQYLMELSGGFSFSLYDHKTPPCHLRDRLIFIRKVAAMSMIEPDDGINMAIFDAKGACCRIMKSSFSETYTNHRRLFNSVCSVVNLFVSGEVSAVVCALLSQYMY